MTAQRTPLRWPVTWKDPSALELLRGTAIDHLVIEDSQDIAPVLARARQQGLPTSKAGSPPPRVTVVDGEWPGVKLTEKGDIDRVSAGPTGVPWIDSNGWKVRLTAEFHAGDEVWVHADPPKMRLSAESYLIAVADAAAHGGRWIISLDDQLAEGITSRKPAALEVWQKVTGAAGFFSARKSWSTYLPEAVLGIISDFAGRNEPMGQELLNLVARTNQQYRILLKTKVSKSSFGGLRAVLYADEEPPSTDLKREILAFIQAGGMLITGPKWGPLPGAPAKEADHPRYSLRIFGKGRLAVSNSDFDDPYLIANDAVTLVSNRYQLLRFWNAGAVGSYFTMDPGRKRAVVHMLFYALLLGDNRPSVRVNRECRKATLWTLDRPAFRKVEMEIQKEAVELHMPTVSEYAAVELEF